MAEAHPTEKIEIWAFDEHRIGLQPVIRQVWIPPEEKAPIVSVYPRYQWTWLYGFVHPESGKTYTLLLPYVNTKTFEIALKHFAQEVGVGNGKHILLVLDQAMWHTTKKLQIPDGIQLEFLPPYSPELQPAERLWPLSNEALVNECFESMEELEDAQAERCVELYHNPALIQGHTLFHWWPRDHHLLN